MSHPSNQQPFDISGLIQALTQQIGTLSQAPAVNFGDTQGAFDAASAAATASQGQQTAAQIAQAQEAAAASGKVFSSASQDRISRIGQEGEVNLAQVLGNLGIRQQDVLGRQTEFTTNTEQRKREQMNQLLSLLTGREFNVEQNLLARDKFDAQQAARSEALARLLQGRSGGGGGGPVNLGSLLQGLGPQQLGPAPRIPGQSPFGRKSSSQILQDQPFSRLGGPGQGPISNQATKSIQEILASIDFSGDPATVMAQIQAALGLGSTQAQSLQAFKS